MPGTPPPTPPGPPPPPPDDLHFSVPLGEVARRAPPPVDLRLVGPRPGAPADPRVHLALGLSGLAGLLALLALVVALRAHGG